MSPRPRVQGGPLPGDLVFFCYAGRDHPEALGLIIAAREDDGLDGIPSYALVHWSQGQGISTRAFTWTCTGNLKKV